MGKAKKLNIGLDLDLWKSAIHLTVDVFHERRTDILCTPGTIPSTIGVTSLPSINAGIVTNKGFEIELEHRKNFRNWGYSVKGNFHMQRIKLYQRTNLIMLINLGNAVPELVLTRCMVI